MTFYWNNFNCYFRELHNIGTNFANLVCYIDLNKNIFWHIDRIHFDIPILYNWHGFTSITFRSISSIRMTSNNFLSEINFYLKESKLIMNNSIGQLCFSLINCIYNWLRWRWSLKLLYVNFKLQRQHNLFA